MPSRTRSGSSPASPSWMRPIALMIWPGVQNPHCKAIVGNKRLLHRMKPVALGHAFDGEDVSAVVADRKRKAGIDPSSVDDDRAGAALAAITTLLGSGQFQAFAKQVQEGDTGVIQLDRSPDAVHSESRREGHAILRKS